MLKKNRQKQQQPEATRTTNRVGKGSNYRGGIWLSENEDKAKTELYFLYCSAFWLLIIAFVVVTKVYESFYDIEYFLLGLLVSTPYLLYPVFSGDSNRKGSSWWHRWRNSYWLKANVWLGIFGFIGNYFWTHYFFKVLGAAYSFPVKFTLNQVPFFLYLVTHAYFCFYHTLTNVLLRRVWSSQLYQHASHNVFLQVSFNTCLVFSLGYATALMEAITISSVPYYHYSDPYSFYLYGSAFYGIYFYVSFPMFLRLDEHIVDGKAKWTLSRTITDSLAACMAVTCLLDFWRLLIGSVGVSSPSSSLPLIAD